MNHQPDNVGPVRAPANVEREADRFFSDARIIVGDRFAEARYDADRGLRVTVIDLNSDDLARLGELTRRLDIADWVRVERAKPDALAAWERLRHDLLELQKYRPGTLDQYPTPDPGYRRPPIAIHLAAHGETVAADLNANYGDFVALTVGALPYPRGSDPPGRPRRLPRDAQRSSLDPDELRVDTDGPLSIRSGDTATYGLLLTNLSDHDIKIHTNGNVTADIVDPTTGVIVGGYTGAQAMPLVYFSAAPGETVRIPLLIGTASFTADLGYTVPPGEWQVTAPLNLDDGRRLTTIPLAITITDSTRD